MKGYKMNFDNLLETRYNTSNELCYILRYYILLNKNFKQCPYNIVHKKVINNFNN